MEMTRDMEAKEGQHLQRINSNEFMFLAPGSMKLFRVSMTVTGEVGLCIQVE